MISEKFDMITYNGNQISLYSDGKDDYVNITEMAKAWKYRKSINKWMANRQTIEFLTVWEKKHNTNFDGSKIGTVLLEAKQNQGVSIGYWIDKTNATGFFTNKSGTFATKDIAIKFAGWLSPEFELYLIEEFQRLKELEHKKNSFELLTHAEVLRLVLLKEVFRYVAHQEMIEDAHKDVYAAQSGSKNPFAEFYAWRNKILDIAPDVINERVREYCINKNIPLTNKLLRKTKRDKILFYDSYDAVRIAVWDFLEIEGEINALTLSELVGNMIRIEKGEVLPKNETDLFHTKQDLKEFTDLDKRLGEIKLVKSAREVLEYRKQLGEKKNKMLSSFDTKLLGLLNTPPPNKNK